MERKALIISHGQPSDPDRAEAALAHLAAAVAGHLPGWQVASATLAKPGALTCAVQGAAAGLVYPMFMAGGWFPKVELPRRMAEAGAAEWTYLLPFGIDPGVQALAVTLLTEAATGLPLRERAVLVAAHGSSRSSVPAEVAQDLAARVKAAGFGRAEAFFIDQGPRIAEARGFGPQALCLPFFAAEGGHVTDDLPQALTEAGFAGRLLPALGLDARVPGIIAAALRAAAP